MEDGLYIEMSPYMYGMKYQTESSISSIFIVLYQY